MSSGRPRILIGTNPDGSIVLQYKPLETGNHDLNANFNENSVEGTPFRCHVAKVASGYVTAFGEGLNFGSCGKAATFEVVGGGKDLEISLNGPSKAELKKEAKGNSTAVGYVPMAPGEYSIDIKVKGQHIHGSPFLAKVTGEGRKRSQFVVGTPSEVSLGGKDVDLTNMVGSIKAPGGASESCILKKMEDGKLGMASFTPKVKGTYEVAVTQEGKAIPGSPFKINVSDNEVNSPAKVKVTGDGLKSPKAQQWNPINIDLNNSGYGTLSVSVEGGHRSDIECKLTAPKQYALQYKPHEPGMYVVNVLFGEDHIAGSPFTVNVGGESSGRVRETVTRDVKEVSATTIGSKCEFQLKIPGTNPLNMEASLTSPTGKTEMCDIADKEHSLYDIKFVPKEEGVHIVSLKHNGLHISGSPFQYTVGPTPSGGTHKVEIGGPGLERGEVGSSNEFNVYTREAGAGQMSIAVEGPSKATMDVVDRGNGYTTVGYVVSKPGEYYVHIKYNNDHVPESPVRVMVTPDSADAKKVTVHGLKERGLEVSMCTVMPVTGEYGIHVKWNDTHVPESPITVNIVPESKDAKKCVFEGLRDRGHEINKAITFNVNKQGAKGELSAHVNVPSGQEKEVFIQEMDRDLYAMRIIPTENGIHYVHVHLNEANIPGSPFAIVVGKTTADPALVLASGDGLSKGEVGKPAKFRVNTTQAGCATLTAVIEGPSKVNITCAETEEGYEFSYTPTSPGDYYVLIKYANVTIAGCPSKSVVTGKGKASNINETSTISVETTEKKGGTTKHFHGDASKVVLGGTGTKKGFMGRPTNFTVDVKNAGNAVLLLGMMTPSGTPLEELSCKQQSKTTYQVAYKAKEKGDHVLHVCWGGEHVPGSPFIVQVT